MRQLAPFGPGYPARRLCLQLAAVALLVLAGCGEEGVSSSTMRSRIAVKDLPEPILAAARKELSGFEIQDAFENRENGKTLQSYEVRGRNKRGKISEVRVSLDGKILERE